MNYKTLEILKNKIEFLESHNKNYTKKQYYNILDLEEIILKEYKKAINKKSFLKNYLRDFILNDDDFLKCFNTYNKDKKNNFKSYVNYIIKIIFEEYENEIYLDKTYLDISYLIINDKIINLDYVYNIFYDYLIN